MPGTVYSRSGPEGDPVGRLADFARFVDAEASMILGEAKGLRIDLPMTLQLQDMVRHANTIADVLSGYTTAGDSPRYSSAVRAIEIIESAARFAEHDPGVDWPSPVHDDPVDAICAALDNEREVSARWRAVVDPDAGASAEKEQHVFRPRDRVTMRYGGAVVVAVIPDEAGQGRPPIYGVVADAGGYWLCDAREMSYEVPS